MLRQGSCLFSRLGDHIFLPRFGRSVALTVRTTERGDSHFASHCVLLLTCHPELSVGNWPGSASPVGLNSEPELDPLKQPMRGGRGGLGRSVYEEREFSAEKSAWEGTAEIQRKWETRLAEESQRAAA